MLSRSLRPLLTLLFVLHTVLAEPQAPPYITEGPPDPVIYFSGNQKEEVKLPCQATGNPEIRYQWMRNGHTVASDKTVPDEPGTFVLVEPDGNDVGLYQCFAENGVGKAMSNTTLVLESSRAHFADEEPVEVRATVGQKLTLECKPTSQSVPTPSLADFWWEKDDTSAARWPLDRRVQIDDMGNLNIAAVQQGDIQDPPLVWQCAINNPIIDVSAKGSRKKIVPSGESTEMPSKPQIMFYTNQTENRGGTSTVAVGLEGRPFDLRCFFSGSDDIGIEWDRTDGGRIPSDTSVQKLELSSRLHFKSLLRSDEGMYNCIGSSHAQPSTRFPIQLHVHAVPTFKLSDDRPINYNATVGENVVFKCNAYAIPEAKVEWYRNGVEIDLENPPSKFHFSQDRRTLRVSSVCKVNCSGRNDLMTIQCNASNVHGYTLGSGFINVFEPTVFIVKPEGITPTFPDPVSFRVKARSDPDTTITYRWYYYDEDSDCEKKWCMVYNVTDKTSVSNENGSVLTILRTEEKDLGKYLCVASNGVRDHNYTVELIEPEYLREAYIWPYWWVILLILLLILIVLITVLCCCCWMRRNRGDEYPVDEKERAADRDPEKELMDSGFHDYQRPTGVWTTNTAGRPSGPGPTGSLSASVGKLGSDEEGSLNEYGSMTPGKFTEDGSFIGQYNPAKTARSQPPPAYQSHA